MQPSAVRVDDMFTVRVGDFLELREKSRTMSGRVGVAGYARERDGMDT
jgi:hypothetical protein